MRSLLDVLVIAATVMHFTFGCCGHPSHGCGDHHECGAEHEDAPVGDAGHDCAGCTCAATIEAHSSGLPHGPTLPPVALCFAEPLPAGGLDTFSPKDRGGPQPSNASHPLYERLLV